MESGGRERMLGRRLGPSPELEAIWGPDADAKTGEPPGSPPPPTPTSFVDDDPWPAPIKLRGTVHDAVVPSVPRGRNNVVRYVIAGLAVAVVFTAAGAGALALRRDGDEPRETVKSAPASTSSAEPATGSTFDGAAFMERFAAAAVPTTTVPTGPPATTETFTAAPSATNRSRITVPSVPVDQSVPPMALDDPRLRGAEQAARDFVAAMTKRDCDAALALFSARTLQFFEAMEADERDFKASFCEMLRQQDMPAVTVHLPARPYGRNGAVVDVEADGEIDKLALLLEGGRWTVDLLGTPEDDESYDEPTYDDEPAYDDEPTYDDYENTPAAQSDLRNALTAERVHFTDYESFTDDLGKLDAIEPSIEWHQGIAPAGRAVPGEVYVTVADGGAIVCLSARAADGTGYMIKAFADGDTSYASGAIPATCDYRPLADRW